MFKITNIYLWNGVNHKDYDLTDTSYVYGKNSVGKTALVELIDHVLGNHEALSHQGLDHLTEVGAKVVNGNSELWLKRSMAADGGFSFKRSQNSPYLDASGDSYRDKIQNIIHERNDTEKLKIYQKVFGEEASFRSFAFLNFIDETNQGDLYSIFTRGRNIKNLVRIPKIMQFLFNYKNVVELYEKTVELEAATDELDRARLEADHYIYYRNSIQRLFRELHLNYQENYNADYQTFLSFKESFKREKPNTSKDLVYLTKASFELSEEIKQYQFIKSQTERASERKKRDEQLLDELNIILRRNPNYKKYLDDITSTIEELQSEKVILTLSDYEGSIKALIDHKRRIDSEIEKIKSQAEDLDYDKAMKCITLLENAFQQIDQTIDVNKQTRLEEEIKELKKVIKELKAKTDVEELKKFNQSLTQLYLDESLDEIKFIDEDIRNNGFSLEFVPMKQQISVWHNEKVTLNDGSEKEEKVSFDPGSLARHTYIQMLLYMSILKYVGENFSEMPILPLLVIDSADQTIQNEYFDKIYPKLVELAKSIGVQLIFMSKELPQSVNKSDVIDISEGLNPYHEA